MSSAGDPEKRGGKGSRKITYFGWLAGSTIVLLILLWLYFPLWPSDPRCLALLRISERSVAIPLPPNCNEANGLTSGAPPALYLGRG
jgi:hypothetical protein